MPDRQIKTHHHQAKPSSLPLFPCALPLLCPCALGAFVPSCLSGYESIMQNKPNVKMGNMNVSTATTKTYAKEQRTMSNEQYPKQTQSNPILSRRSPERSRIPLPPSCAGKESRISERNAYPDLSDQHQRSRIQYRVSSIEYRVSSIEYRVSSIEYRVSGIQLHCAKQTQFSKGQNQCNPLCRKGLRK